jgi:hypothetical protein
LLAAALLCMAGAGCQSPPTSKAGGAAERPSLPKAGQEMSLFDGRTMGLWKPSDFLRSGHVSIKDGAIHIPQGNNMTGITWTGPVIPMNYEITLEGMRVEGSDFFCALTFPVGENPCTLVLGGWGGNICGLSSLDGYDASENLTTQSVQFETGRWYHVRLRVVPNRIQAWLDAEPLVDVDTTGRRIGIRIEVEESRPLGIATWRTEGAVRNIFMRRLAD